MKLLTVTYGKNTKEHGFWCPGCNTVHFVTVEGGPPTWGFDGNRECPTFTPSILVRRVARLNEDAPKPFVCHSFVTAGTIRYQGDCTHHLVGQTVPMQDVPLDWI